MLMTIMVARDASILDSAVQNQTVKGVTDQTVDITYPDLSSKWTVVSGEQPTYKLTAMAIKKLQFT